jgi:MarR family transcriptional regulator for hemolysin
MLTLICFYDGKLSQKALAKMMDKDKSSIVGIIDMLSARGYVSRETNPADRREHLIKVTEKAKKEVPQIVNVFNDINKQISSGITDEEMEIFEKVVNKMQQNLKSSATEILNNQTK